MTALFGAHLSRSAGSFIQRQSGTFHFALTARSAWKRLRLARREGILSTGAEQFAFEVT